MRHILQHFILSIIANALALFLVQYLLQSRGFMISPPVLGFIFVGMSIAILNTIVRPVLRLMTFPLVILTMGLFLIVINAIILYLTEYFFNELFASTLSVTFHVGNGALAYLIAAFLFSVFNSITHWLLAKH